MRVLVIVNSIIGRPGNIGFRVEKFLSHAKGNLDPEIISRTGYTHAQTDAERANANWFFEILFRGLNAVRIFGWRKFPQKKWERIIFSKFAIFYFKSQVRKKEEISCVYTTECFPEILEYFRSRSIPVVLDFPIAPSLYVESLRANGTRILTGNPAEIPFEKKAMELATEIVVPSDFVGAEVRKQVSNVRITKIPFGVDCQRFMPSGLTRSAARDFVFAGSGSKRKGLTFLLEAWSNLVVERPGLRLHLCGRIYPEIKKLILDLGIENSVILPGFVDVSKYFSQCDVYIFPSLMEGSSKSIYEAMACGLPVITTYESGSIVQGGVEGLLISKCSTVEIEIALRAFSDGGVDIERMSRAARSKAEMFPWDRYSSSLQAVLCRVTQ